MQISKKTVYVFRVIMWGGLVLAAIGALLYYAEPNMINISLILLGGGLILSLVGAALMRRLFRCPHCKTNVLGDDSSIDLRMTKVPSSCPRCGSKVELTD